MPAGDRPRGDHHHPLAALLQRRDLLADRVEHVRAQGTVVGGDDRGAELDDEGHGSQVYEPEYGANALVRDSRAPPPKTLKSSEAARRFGRRLPSLSRIQLELVLADADLVAGLEAGRAQGGDHADLVESLLEVGERLLVGDVVALEEQLDAAAEDAEGALPSRSTE